jgi:VIT1/CCC1 family predicted Fe2+/Mn2+ transporter
MNINPVANGNKTAAGAAALTGSSVMGAAVILLPYFGVDEKTTTIILGAVPAALLLIAGVGHKIVKAGGCVGMWRWFKANIIGAGK